MVCINTIHLDIIMTSSAGVDAGVGDRVSGSDSGAGSEGVIVSSSVSREKAMVWRNIDGSTLDNRKWVRVVLRRWAAVVV